MIKYSYEDGTVAPAIIVTENDDDTVNLRVFARNAAEGDTYVNHVERSGLESWSTPASSAPAPAPQAPQPEAPQAPQPEAQQAPQPEAQQAPQPEAQPAQQYTPPQPEPQQ